MIKKDFSTVKAAQKTRHHEKHKKLQAWISNLKQKVNAKWFDKAARDSWVTVYTTEENRQLQEIGRSHMSGIPYAAVQSACVR